MPENRKITIFLIIGLIVGFAAGFLFKGGNFSNQPSLPRNTANQNQESKVSLMVDFGDGDVKTYNDISISQGENLFDAMKKVIQEGGVAFEYKEYKDLGMLITKIKDKENGAGNKYWQYWVDNKKADVGASSYFPQNNDIIEWKFIPYKGE